jgi:GWxTD domain-containing protein
MRSEKIHRVILHVSILILVLFINMTLFTVAHAYGMNQLEMSLKSKGSLLFYADVCQFEGQNGKNRVEVVYSLDVSQIQPDSSRNYAECHVHIKITDMLGRSIVDSYEKKVISIDTGNSDDNYAFVDLKKFAISPDTVRFVLAIYDSLNNKKGKIDEVIKIKNFSAQLSVSDPLFISYVQKAQEDNIFVRHNLVMLPSPSRFYSVSKSNPNVMLYFEINNLTFDPENPSTYSLACAIEDLQGNEMRTLKKPALSISNANSARMEKIDVTGLLSSVYRLRIQLIDNESQVSTSTWKYFRIYNDQQSDDLILPMTDEDIQKYYDQIKYITSDREKSLYKKLDLKGKQQFLLQFWKSKDPYPETYENEFMEEHFRKLAYCEENFKGGINSDMARIFIKYGQPMDIERKHSAAGLSVAVEIWTYAVNGSTEFVFVDRIRDGHFVLVHSTHPDEYTNLNWMNDLK